MIVHIEKQRGNSDKREIEKITVTFQHSPMNVSLSENIKCGQETIVVIASKWFGEEVGKIVGRGYLFEQDRPRFDKFTKVMVSDVDVLNFSVVLSSLRKCNRPTTISPYDSWFVVFDFHFI